MLSESEPGHETRIMNADIASKVFATAPCRGNMRAMPAGDVATPPQRRSSSGYSHVPIPNGKTHDAWTQTT